MRTVCPCCGQGVEAKLPIADMATNTIAYQGRSVRIRAQAIDAYITLAEAFPRILSRDTLITSIWGYNVELKNEVESLRCEIATLRKALKKIDANVEIETHHLRGYALREVKRGAETQ